MKLPMLELEHEQKLARLWKDKRDEKALHELTSAHVRLVVAIAAKFRNYGLPMGDLVQEGNIGLMQAADRFDPDREVRFSPMPVGGSVHKSKIMCCAIGRLSAPAPPRRKNHCFSICVGCAPALMISAPI